MATPQRRPQKPRVLFVPAGTAPPRMAALAHRPATEGPSFPSGETRPGTGPSADFTRWLPPSLPRLSRPVSLPRLPRSLRCAAPLLGAPGTGGTPSLGRFVIYQRRLAHGSTRLLDRLERFDAPAQSTPGGQSQSISDSPLGPHPPPRQPHP